MHSVVPQLHLRGEEGPVADQEDHRCPPSTSGSHLICTAEKIRSVLLWFSPLWKAQGHKSKHRKTAKLLCLGLFGSDLWSLGQIVNEVVFINDAYYECIDSKHLYHKEADWIFSLWNISGGLYWSLPLFHWIWFSFKISLSRHTLMFWKPIKVLITVYISLSHSLFISTIFLNYIRHSIEYCLSQLWNYSKKTIHLLFFQWVLHILKVYICS